MADAFRRDGQRVGSYRHPIYRALFPVPVVCFLGALLTDVAYMQCGAKMISF